jgi:hypothetical protein
MKNRSNLIGFFSAVFFLHFNFLFADLFLCVPPRTQRLVFFPAERMSGAGQRKPAIGKRFPDGRSIKL